MWKLVLRMRGLMTNQLAPSIEKELERGASRKSGIRPDKLIAAASGDPVRLADALWVLVREGKGAVVGQDRSILGLLEEGAFDAEDFVSLLRQLKGANLYWFEHWEEEISGLAYHGWSSELEKILQQLLARNIDITPLEWADVSEPAGSSLLFALSRRGLVDSQLLPPGAIQRFARGLVWREFWCREQFTGWERLWSTSAWAKAIFTILDDVPFVSLSADMLRPLIEFATPGQLARLVDMLLMKEPESISWLVARGKAIVPHLEARIATLLQQARKGSGLNDSMGQHAGALARLRGAKKEIWPSVWVPLIKPMLEQDLPGLRDVLQVVEPKTREKLLIEHLRNDENWAHRLRPLTYFPTTRLVQALVDTIRTSAESEQWDRAPLVATLGNMGAEGQAALEKLLEDPSWTADVLTNLTPTIDNVARTIPLLESKDIEIQMNAVKLWFEMKNDDRIELVARHFDELPPYHIAALLAKTHFHPRAAELAERLPDAPGLMGRKSLCSSPPEQLRNIIAAMQKTPQEAIVRAERALAPMFDQSKRDDDDEEDETKFDLVATLAKFGLEDLPAILHVTAFRLRGDPSSLRALCHRFWPLCPEIPWITVFWWMPESSFFLKEAESLLGEAMIPALRERLALGLMGPSEAHDLIPIFTKFDPIFGFDYAAKFAGNSMYFLPVKAAFIAALEKGSSRAQEWLVEALGGKEREFALRFLREVAVPDLLPNLYALQNQKLPIKLKKILAGAIEAQGTCGATIVRSEEKLTGRLVRKISRGLRSLQATTDGRIWAAQTENAITVWQDETTITIDAPENAVFDLTPDGRFLLVGSGNTVRVFEPWKSGKELLRTLETRENLTAIVGISDHRAFTLCFGQETQGALMLWHLESGAAESHRLNGFPAKLHAFGDGKYIVATKDELLSIRDVDRGKVLGKLQTWSHYGCGGTCGLAVGNGGKLVATLFFDGGLMIWDISGPKVKQLGAHVRAAPRALVTDPNSTWVVTPSIREVKTWKLGQPARSLEGSGAPAIRRDELFSEAGLAIFVRAGVVAVGGQSVDLWDLAASRHLGKWDKPVAAIAAVGGKIFVGDAEGNIWELGESMKSDEP